MNIRCTPWLEVKSWFPDGNPGTYSYVSGGLTKTVTGRGMSPLVFLIDNMQGKCIPLVDFKWQYQHPHKLQLTTNDDLDRCFSDLNVFGVLSRIIIRFCQFLSRIVYRDVFSTP